MTGSSDRSPNPSEVGFPLMSRRQMLIAAAGTVGAGALLAACGSDDDEAAPADTGAATPDTGAEASGDGVTFGSNYSDEKPKAGMQAAIDATGVATKVNTVDHNTYQENFNTYIQQPDDVVCWFAGYRMRAFAEQGCRGRHLRRLGRPARHERRLQERLERDRRQAVLRAASTSTRGPSTTG